MAVGTDPLEVEVTAAPSAADAHYHLPRWGDPPNGPFDVRKSPKRNYYRRTTEDVNTEYDVRTGEVRAIRMRFSYRDSI
jgi:hypothetical protein